MSLDNLAIKEKTSIINLDSDSDFDKKSLAKSITIDDLENEKLGDSSAKETDNNKLLDVEHMKNSHTNSSNIKVELLKPSLEVSDSKVHEEKPQQEADELLIFEKASDVHKIFNCEKKMGSEEVTKNNKTELNEGSKKTTEDGSRNSAYVRLQDQMPQLEEKTLLQKIDILDKNLSLIIHDWHLGKNFDVLIYIFARLFNPDFIVSYFLFILSYKIYSNADYLFVMKPIASTVFCLAVTLSLKKHFGRSRPEYSKKSKRLFDLRKHEKNCSMPSGDSLQAANFSIILFFYFNSNVGFFLIPFVMFARVYFYCHFISDTIVGAVLGIFSSTLVYYSINLY